LRIQVGHIPTVLSIAFIFAVTRLKELAVGIGNHSSLAPEIFFRSRGALCAALITGAFALCGTQLLHGSVRLPRVIGDHMVLQRDQPIHIWGWATAGENIVVTLGQVQRSVQADQSGNWAVDLPPMKAGGPFKMTIEGGNLIELDDILIGDLWVASGQSNMELPLGGTPQAKVNNAEQEIQSATHPGIRLFLADKVASTYPLVDLQQKSGWSLCSPETVTKFSALALFFGREVAATENVPVGLIASSWGGTPAEAWISLSGLTGDASLNTAFDDFNRMATIHGQDVHRWAIEDAEDALAKSQGLVPPVRNRNHSFDGAGPGTLFNGMIAPLLPLRVRGVIWYQGEANATPLRAPIYDRLFPAMIRDWRKEWQQGDLPFLFVQLANWDAQSGLRWPLVREAQRHALSLPNTAMAVTIDVGESNNIHPGNKQAVGHRLALAARAVVYHEPVEFSGPLYFETSLEPGALRVWFHHADVMHTTGANVPGFELSGDDHVFLPATEARIDGQTIVLSNPKIPRPISVRYGWEDDPKLDLYNAANLPASPFSSVDESRPK
jgi:sialate O-acetylesterase